jgi:prevent-host-death family protein
MRTFGATEFKARCLTILDQVSRTGEEVTITKRGKPVARLIPPRSVSANPLRHPLRGSVEITGDIVAPALPPAAWAALGRDRRPPGSKRPGGGGRR